MRQICDFNTEGCIRKFTSLLLHSVYIRENHKHTTHFGARIDETTTFFFCPWACYSIIQLCQDLTPFTSLRRFCLHVHSATPLLRKSEAVDVNIYWPSLPSPILVSSWASGVRVQISGSPSQKNLLARTQLDFESSPSAQMALLFNLKIRNWPKPLLSHRC